MFCGEVLVLLVYICSIHCSSDHCEKNQLCKSTYVKNRYLFYDVNPPEGFNLRRDVYLRFAVFAHNLQKFSNKNLNRFKLVLPPWTNLYHWRTQMQQHIPWSHFFDLGSLQKFAPVVEMYQFFQDVGFKYNKINIDEVYVLQHFEDMFETGKFEDKMAVQNCIKPIKTNFFYYDNITSDNINCLSFHGYASQLSTILKNSESKLVFIDHAEIALHDSFGDKIYWQARRSMRFNNELVGVATTFRKVHLESDDESDDINRPVDWRDEKPGRNANGGPYLSIHLRRGDFVWGRPNQVPTMENASKQIIELLLKLGLNKIFIATDADDKEYGELANTLKDFEVYRFLPDKYTEENYNEGEAAIIDQIICSHAKYFVGTHESTFSFRIQEEREIMGFPIETTFNRLCGDNSKCERPTVWKIVH